MGLVRKEILKPHSKTLYELLPRLCRVIWYLDLVSLTVRDAGSGPS